MGKPVLFAKDLTEKNGRFYIELELDPEELQAIGHLSAQWAFLEFYIFEYTKTVCGIANIAIPKEAASDSFRKRMRTWDTIVRTLFPTDSIALERILGIIKRTGELSGRRHKLIHGLIQWDPKNKETLNVYSRANPRNIPWKVDATEIEAFAREIATLNADFMNVHNENPDFPDLTVGAASLRRPGTPVPAEIPPEYSSGLKTILATRKLQKQSSED